MKPAQRGYDLAISLVLFVIAVSLRWPSCYESLWLDELHTAWTVDGAFAEVAGRAVAGNQSPVFYWGLWLYRSLHLPLTNELSFRLPAVIASSLGAVVVYASLRQATNHRWIALASGLCFALQSHLLFFGTEARVFGLVILLSCLVCHWFITDRHFWWIVGCSLLAIAIQPVAAPWFVLLSVSAWLHQRLRCNLWQWKPVAVAAVLGLLTVAASWSALDQAWSHRQQWAAFGSATSLRQLTTAFPWTALVWLPLAMLLVAKIASRLSGCPRVDLSDSISTIAVKQNAHSQGGRRCAELAVLSFVTVLLYWIIAYQHIAPIYHRRYFIAALPPLFWFAGAATDQAVACFTPWLTSTAVRSPRTWIGGTLALVAASLPLAWIARHESATAKLVRGNPVLVSRNEDWREAVQWLGSRHEPATTAYLDAGLIENDRLLADTVSESRELAVPAHAYLSFPLQGPYRWNHVVAISRNQWDARSQLPLVLRASKQQAEALVRRQLGAEAESALLIEAFGNLTVVDRLPSN